MADTAMSRDKLAERYFLLEKRVMNLEYLRASMPEHFSRATRLILATEKKLKKIKRLLRWL